jgi:hypothetical protein
MYEKKIIAKRRPPGWTERRRYFRRLFELARTKALRDEEIRKLVPVSEKA